MCIRINVVVNRTEKWVKLEKKWTVIFRKSATRLGKH